MLCVSLEGTVMAKIKQTEQVREPVHKRTSQGGRVCKTSTMNKHVRRCFKKEHHGDSHSEP